LIGLYGLLNGLLPRTALALDSLLTRAKFVALGSIGGDMSVQAAILTLNLGGLLSGMAGTVLLYYFGVPRQVDTGGVVLLALEGDQGIDRDEQGRIRRFKRLGRLGLGFLFVAFLLQFVALLLGTIHA